MELLKQSTAVTLLIGPFLDSTNGDTAETALTISQADVRLSKNGGNMAQKGNATACTHDEIGYYTCPLSTTDTGTLGILKVMVHETGALPVWHSFMVVTANVYDTLCSTDLFNVNVTHVADTSQTANDNGADINAILTDTNELQGDWTNAGRLDTILDSILTDTGTTIQGELDDIQAAVITNAAGVDIAADIIALKAETALIVADTNELQGDWANAGRLDTILDSILTDTAVIGVAGAGLTNINLPNQAMDITGNLSGSVGSVTTVSDKTGYALSAAGNNAIWDATEGITGQSHSFETILARLYRFMLNKMVITNSTGAVALRNEADGADIMTQTVTDNATITNRTAGGW